MNQSILNQSVISWYNDTYTTDDIFTSLISKWKLDTEDLKHSLTFNDLLNVDIFYIIDWNDSVVRERIFSKLSEITGKTYNYFYNLWLNNKIKGKLDLFGLMWEMEFNKEEQCFYKHCKGWYRE